MTRQQVIKNKKKILIHKPSVPSTVMLGSHICDFMYSYLYSYSGLKIPLYVYLYSSSRVQVLEKFSSTFANKQNCHVVFDDQVGGGEVRMGD